MSSLVDFDRPEDARFVCVLPEEIKDDSCEVKARVPLEEISLPDDFFEGRGLPYKDASLVDILSSTRRGYWSSVMNQA